MSKQPSIGEVSTNSKLFLKFCLKPALTLPLAAWLAIFTILTEAKAAEPVSLPIRIETLDQRSFEACKLVRAEPDALLIRHSKGIARLPFALLNSSLKEAFNYDPDAAYEAAYAHYKKEQQLRKWKFREEETVRAMRKMEVISETIKSTWIPVETTVIRSTEKGIYVAPMEIGSNDSSGRILRPFRDRLLFLPENSLGLQPGSLWMGYICPRPDDTVLDLNGEMFTVPFHQAITVGCQNTGGK
ncbi:hypothetical protein VSU19_06245 [Verrucomicrobiales bacterium BCK34]|nr:hypothetical protein [Verrucomicrobiales bacterium BCK34]